MGDRLVARPITIEQRVQLSRCISCRCRYAILALKLAQNAVVVRARQSIIGQLASSVRNLINDVLDPLPIPLPIVAKYQPVSVFRRLGSMAPACGRLTDATASNAVNIVSDFRIGPGADAFDLQLSNLLPSGFNLLVHNCNLGT